MRLSIFLLIWLPIFGACKRDNKAKEDKINSMETAESVRQLYCAESKAAYEAEKFVHGRCDGLTFTAWYALACPENDVDLSVFEADGRFYRDPDHECGPQHADGKYSSKSTISNDGLLALAQASVKANDKETVQKILDYADSHDYIMGDCKKGSEDLCRIWPNLYDLLSDFTGKRRLTDSTNWSEWVGVKGYRAHLAVNLVLLSGQVHGAINDIELRILKDQAEREPNNGVYQAAYHLYKDGDQSSALKSLERFPTTRLPNNHEDYCTEYLFQRDQDDSDWAPCKDEAYSEHSGTDLSYAVMIMRGEIK